MKKLRALHLYLGCTFAPMILFFAVSGIWQMLGLAYDPNHPVFSELSTIHTSRGIKGGGNLSSPLLRFFEFAMAFGLIATTIIGIVMAFRVGGNRRTPFYCLAVGLLLPLVLVCLKAGIF